MNAVRQNELYQNEHRLWDQGYKRVMGLDEVGRGCLCGPVVAAGVIIEPYNYLHNEIQDSKKLTRNKREELAVKIRSEASFWIVSECTSEEIDQINILKASLKAMAACADSEGAVPDYLLVDGNRYPDTLVPHTCLVKGDTLSASIAAASILAKVHRDEWMMKIHEVYPEFGWDKNVGYPTKEHYEALLSFGSTPYHRRSFNLKTTNVYTHR
ncbi:MAG: ribonuclease HII [Balneolaceae bacterium]|nr:MAG: ribonuclease HII [Balneolaceae bacterium]